MAEVLEGRLLLEQLAHQAALAEVMDGEAAQAELEELKVVMADNLALLLQMAQLLRLAGQVQLDQMETLIAEEAVVVPQDKIVVVSQLMEAEEVVPAAMAHNPQ